MGFLTPGEARARFGSLLTAGPVATFLSFKADGGTWKPVYQGIWQLIGYEFEWD